jgi:hypothetical protein
MNAHQEKLMAFREAAAGICRWALGATAPTGRGIDRDCKNPLVPWAKAEKDLALDSTVYANL